MIQNGLFELKLEISPKTCFFNFFEIKNVSFGFHRNRKQFRTTFLKTTQKRVFSTFQNQKRLKNMFSNFFKFKNHPKNCFYGFRSNRKTSSKRLFELKLKTSSKTDFSNSIEKNSPKACLFNFFKIKNDSKT